MKRNYDDLRQLAAKMVALQAKARALGLFANDRELCCPFPLDTYENRWYHETIRGSR